MTSKLSKWSKEVGSVSTTESSKVSKRSWRTHADKNVNPKQN